MKSNLINAVTISAVTLLFVLSCQEKQNNQPRPRQYPKIIFPEKSYHVVKVEDCDFAIDLPDYSQIKKKENLLEEEPGHPCWFDIHFTPFNATVHMSYYHVRSPEGYEELVDDAYTMVEKHNVKATFRAEYDVNNSTGSTGKIFSIDGPVASPYQFFITDKTNNFLRGSLYFDEKINRDSVQVIIDFLKTDIEHLMNTISWASKTDL